MRLRKTTHFLFSLWSVICLLHSLSLKAQRITYTANDKISPYSGEFRAGVNFDVYRGFTDEDLALLAAGSPEKGVQGAGIKALRPGFFEDFAELFGYDSRINAFKYYDQLGMKAIP